MKRGILRVPESNNNHTTLNPLVVFFYKTCINQIILETWSKHKYENFPSNSIHNHRLKEFDSLNIGKQIVKGTKVCQREITNELMFLHSMLFSM